MRAIFNFVKEAGITLDGLWIESGGHKITVIDTQRREDPTFYAFYNMPKIGQCNIFGIDAPDEMEVEINRDVFLNNQDLFKLTGKLKIEDGTWIITNRNWIYNRFLGKYRIGLMCQAYHESVTTGINDPCFDNAELDEE